MNRPLPRSGPMFIVCRGDGKHMLASLNGRFGYDDNSVWIPAGFGLTVADALRELAEQLDDEVGYTNVGGHLHTIRSEQLKSAHEQTFMFTVDKLVESCYRKYIGGTTLCATQSQE